MDIGRVLLIEFKRQDPFVFDEVIEVLKRQSGFEYLQIEEDPISLVPGIVQVKTDCYLSLAFDENYIIIGVPKE